MGDKGGPCIPGPNIPGPLITGLDILTLEVTTPPCLTMLVPTTGTPYVVDTGGGIGLIIEGPMATGGATIEVTGGPLTTVLVAKGAG